MGLAERIGEDFDDLQDDVQERLGEAAEVYARTLRAVLGNSGSKDRPSRPGEAPHEVTGELVESVAVELYPGQGLALVGPTAPYAGKLAKTRPYTEIAADQCRDEMREVMFGNRETKGGGA